MIALTTVILAGLTIITERKDSVEKFTLFFGQEADFDVLFMGSSKVINGILPMELWNDYGIVSYNLGGHANAIPTSYWVLKNALDYTTPKCVVFDCMGAGWDSWIIDNSYAHFSFDAFPLSLTKIQAVCDLINPEKEENAYEKRLELLWNFSVYHGRWEELSMRDFRPNVQYHKGAESRVNVSIPAEMATVSPNDRVSTDTRNTQYLIKAIELCKERGIDILLIHLPYPTNETERIAANTVADVAERYDVEYLNFLNMDVVDYQTDMHDPDSHLNPSGAFKITDYLGKFLSEKYGIPDQRENADYQSWYTHAEEYRQEKIGLFQKANCAWNYWMLLSDDDFSFVAEVSEKDIQCDEVLAALLRNAGIQPERVQGRCIIAADRVSGSVTYTAYESLLQRPVETALGTLLIEEEAMKLNGQVCWKIQEPDPAPAVMRFALLNAEKEPEGSARFSAEEIRSPNA